MAIDGQREYSFEYCAARYLDLWLRKEKYLHEQLKNRPYGRKPIKEILNYFSVIRFSEIGRPDVADMVARMLRRVAREKTVEPVAMVESLAKNWCEYTGSRQLSAASKLLWMRKPDKFYIYDRRAVTALHEHLGILKSKNEKSYGVYCKAWKEGFEKCEEGIRQAIKVLPKYEAFTRDPRDRTGWHEEVTKPWFEQRVFDQYLWLVGENKGKQAKSKK